jgi:hypothetical protein
VSEPAATGTVQLPLVTQANGNTYRLIATIYIYGPTYDYINTGDNPTETVLTRTLQTGSYTAYLSDWALERLDKDGTFKPVSAYLSSDYYFNFVIYNQSSTTITFQFDTDGVIVAFGSGQLNVKFNVNEYPPACTVLGNDCGDGAWCPPPGLTGAPVTCMSAGWLSVGDACESPTQCGRNSSCLDLGTGSKCVALCDVETDIVDCPSGSSCVGSGSDYGLCVPDGLSLPDAGAGGASSTGGTSWGTGGCCGYGGKGGVGGSTW